MPPTLCHRAPPLGPRAPEGTSEAALAQLPRATLTQADAVQGVGRKAVRDCPICLDPFAQGHLVRTLSCCGYPYHLDCVDTWLRQRGDCPLCRCRVGADEAAARQACAP